MDHQREGLREARGGRGLGPHAKGMDGYIPEMMGKGKRGH